MHSWCEKKVKKTFCCRRESARCIVSVARYIQQYNTLSAVFIINSALHLPHMIKFCCLLFGVPYLSSAKKTTTTVAVINEVHVH